MRVLGLMILAVMVIGVSGLLMLGWAYEGPHRLLVRLKQQCAG